MNNLTRDEIMIILTALQKEYGFGYSDKPGIGVLQAKLSVWLEVKQRQGN